MKTSTEKLAMKGIAGTIVILAMIMSIPLASAGLLDPDCTVENAAKSAAAKATVGVGGRCSPTEAAKDTAKKATGIEGKGAIEKLGSDGKSADLTKGAVKKVVK